MQNMCFRWVLARSKSLLPSADLLQLFLQLCLERDLLFQLPFQLLLQLPWLSDSTYIYCIIHVY